MKRLVTVWILALLCQETLFSTFCFAASTVDHLVPLEKNYGLLSKYERLTRAKLLLTSGDVARFISLPGSASVETSVSVYQMRSKRGSLPGDYWVTVTQAKKSLWEAAQSDSNAKAVTVERLDAPLPREVAQTIHEAWVRTLRGVKATPRSEEVMVDSTQEIFSAWFDGSIMEGQASFHPGPRTKSLIQIAFSLIEYCDKPPARRNKMASEIEVRARKLLKADQH